MEEDLKGSGLSYTIIRSTLVFGEGDLLLHNMAWALRRFPAFPAFWDGNYKVQPICTEDLADLVVRAGPGIESLAADPAGPDTFSFGELLWLLASPVNASIRLVQKPPSLGLALTRMVGLFLRDLALTRDEVDGLMAGLQNSDAVPTGATGLYDWLLDNAGGLGRYYGSEQPLHSRRQFPSSVQ